MVYRASGNLYPNSVEAVSESALNSPTPSYAYGLGRRYDVEVLDLGWFEEEGTNDSSLLDERRGLSEPYGVVLE